MSIKYTAEEVREREHALIGVLGRPNAWWPYGEDTSDCLAFQLERLGVRTRNQVNPAYYRSIAAFRDHFGWNTVPISKLRPGDLVCEDWPDDGDPINREEPGHIEYVAAIDHTAAKITTISANTGPEPGKPRPNGVHKKTRDLGPNFIVGIVVPYKQPTPSRARIAEVKRVAAYVNARLAPGTPPTPAAKTGIEDRQYRLLVQTYGRAHGIYGLTFKIDGEFGNRSRYVEKFIDGRARAALKK